MLSRRKFLGLFFLILNLFLGGVIEFGIEGVVVSAGVVNFAKPCEDEKADESWRKDVRIELFDVVSGEKKCAKKIRVFGIPDCIYIFNSLVYVDGCCMMGSSRSVDFKFNKEDHCYEAVFYPALDDKFHNCRNLGFGFDMDFFNVRLDLNYKNQYYNYLNGKRRISSLRFKVSNKGLNKPKYLSDFNNFKVEAFSNDCGSFLKIYGVPVNVSEITVMSIGEEQDDQDKDWVEVVVREDVCRSKEDGNFVLNYVPTKAHGKKVIHLVFYDDDGYEYEIYNNILVR